MNKSLGVHPVISPRQILIGKKFKTSLCKIGKLVMMNDMTANNTTSHPRVFFSSSIGPRDSCISHIVVNLSTMKLVTTPNCKPKPMAKDIITIIDEVVRKERMPDRIKFQNMYCK